MLNGEVRLVKKGRNELSLVVCYLSFSFLTFSNFKGSVAPYCPRLYDGSVRKNIVDFFRFLPFF